MMRKRLLGWLGAGCFALLVAPVQAVPISDTFVVTIDDGTDIEFALFDVTEAGGFRIDARRTAGNVDPELFLFNNRGTGELTLSDYFSGQFLNDDDSGPGNNSRINRYLGLGSYVLAAGDYPLSAWEVVLGYNAYNPVPRTGDIRLSVVGRDFRRHGISAGTASFTPTYSDVPEPTSLALLGIGLVGVAAAARRRRFNS